ncbi:hypothetical protein GCM10023153_20270 [Ornithinibacter aureus]|uniref:Nitroreductase family deazaflavin-dependent oxidoreductase n=1 Tax=Ornithinibacter aureus TaxID=622664 RepID=A0ABP8JWN2_9MICO|nr:nitroreductase family deazaflavin-dependent oxidoreductase [Ornithinibacter aureus]KAF0835616.1 deazaflavin-dependent oxidoreductase (nitroreductase family) [Ornithinibacter aureus]
MGLAADLDYRITTPNPAQRGVRRAGSARVGSKLLARYLPAMDRTVARLSRGRTTAIEMLAGLPIIALTTTGRRTGTRRHTQLVAIPHEATLALLGTNFGGPSTPTWALNLEANPAATVAFRDREVEVVARAATEAERAQVLATAATIYVGYPKYLARISGRTVRIFVLEPCG